MRVPGVEFNADEFREGIRTAMLLGTPEDEQLRPVFEFAPDTQAREGWDDDGVPFDPSVDWSAVAVESVTALCTVEWFDGQGKALEWGATDPTKVRLTFLDEDYAKVRREVVDDSGESRWVMFHEVVIGLDRFRYVREETPLALSEVGVHIIHCTAVDDV